MFAGLVSCGNKPAESVITIQVTDGKTKEVPVIYLSDGSQISVALSQDVEGAASGVATINNNCGTYVRLGYQYTSRVLWITPGSEVTVSFESGKFYRGVDVAGANADINGFLKRKV